mmetsp:Transcript_46255/g.144670  ORF Transcript_46255/g.144670 Transcript_46255/m.144670 type:complete len:327 (-) Transcript_46255:707-1687(-)
MTPQIYDTLNCDGPANRSAHTHARDCAPQRGRRNGETTKEGHESVVASKARISERCDLRHWRGRQRESEPRSAALHAHVDLVAFLESVEVCHLGGRSYGIAIEGELAISDVEALLRTITLEEYGEGLARVQRNVFHVLRASLHHHRQRARQRGAHHVHADFVALHIHGVDCRHGLHGRCVAAVRLVHGLCDAHLRRHDESTRSKLHLHGLHHEALPLNDLVSLDEVDKVLARLNPLDINPLGLQADGGRPEARREAHGEHAILQPLDLRAALRARRAQSGRPELHLALELRSRAGHVLLVRVEFLANRLAQLFGLRLLQLHGLYAG